jgi:hypothetical protein
VSVDSTPVDVLWGLAPWALVEGRWEEALDGVEVDAVICDPPYSARTHDRQCCIGGRRELSYAPWSKSEVDAFVDSWAPRNRGWFVCLSDSKLCGTYEAAYERNGLTTFAPVGILIPGMTVRLAGDGPSSWMLYANVARPKSLRAWGTLPGGYTGPPGERIHIGGKPEWLMRALVRDYTRRGDLVCDPVAGAATTMIAALMEGRRTVGAEVDPDTCAVGLERLGKGYTPPLFGDEKPEPEQVAMPFVAVGEVGR